MGAAVAGGDGVDERPDVLVGGLGPGQREMAAEAVVVLLALEHERQRGDALVAALGVDGVEEIGHAAVVAELHARVVLLVDELDDQSLVEVGLDLEPLGDQHRVVVERLEDLRVGREGDGRARASRRLALLDRPERLAAAVFLDVGRAVAADLGDQALGERIDDAGARRRADRRRPCRRRCRTCRRRAAW